MARFKMNEADNYGASKSNYFTLNDDKDSAIIRFLYNDMNDVEGVAVHEVENNGRKMDVECLRAYNQPVEVCPLCAAGYKQNAKIFIPIYDETSNESKIWTRGKTFFSKLSSLCSHYNPLVATPFEVERIGKRGDASTRYETYPKNSDHSRIEDFEPIQAEGLAFHSKTADEMKYFLSNGQFPEKQNIPIQQPNNPNIPVRRRPINNNSEDIY